MSPTIGDVPLVEFMYLVFTCMPGERYHRKLGSLLLLCFCDVFRGLINSLVCWSHHFVPVCLSLASSARLASVVTVCILRSSHRPSRWRRSPTCWATRCRSTPCRWLMTCTTCASLSCGATCPATPLHPSPGVWASG